MKTIKSKLFAFAFVALGLTAGVTSCSKDKTEEENADFSGTYYGSYDILNLLEVPDTIEIKNTGENKISVFSIKLDTSFTATVTGNKATFDGFQAETFKTGDIILTGIDVKAGDGTLKNDTDLTIKLRGVSVNAIEGGDQDIELLKKLFPLKGVEITTKKTFKKNN